MSEQFSPVSAAHPFLTQLSMTCTRIYLFFGRELFAAISSIHSSLIFWHSKLERVWTGLGKRMVKTSRE